MSGTSRTAELRQLAARDLPAAEAALEAFIGGLFDLKVEGLRINVDQYSLNSLNGTFTAADQGYFFKFHQEEGEEEMRGEYYRAEILAKAGLPVDRPLYMSRLPGEQVLVYAKRDDRRFSDVLFDLDLAPDTQAAARCVAAEATLNDHLLEVAEETLKPITPEMSEAEPIHRLFHERLIDPAQGQYPGGRLKRFYVDKVFRFPGEDGEFDLDWSALSTARPVLNGIAYADTLGELFDRAYRRCAPAALADAGGTVAHGDAHNANVWYERGTDQDRLSLFDPAFAGDAVPSLLAEVKSTFHNVFAHPFWLYNPEIAEQRYKAQVRYDGTRLFIDTDWQPNPLRRALLEAKQVHFWAPWIARLRDEGLLPEDWEDVIRLGLFMSPTLVMNLNAGEGADRHNPTSSAIGLMVALMVGSRPLEAEDICSHFFAGIRG